MITLHSCIIEPSSETRDIVWQSIIRQHISCHLKPSFPRRSTFLTTIIPNQVWNSLISDGTSPSQTRGPPTPPVLGARQQVSSLLSAPPTSPLLRTRTISPNAVHYVAQCHPIDNIASLRHTDSNIDQIKNKMNLQNDTQILKLKIRRPFSKSNSPSQVRDKNSIKQLSPCAEKYIRCQTPPKNPLSTAVINNGISCKTDSISNNNKTTPKN